MNGLLKVVVIVSCCIVAGGVQNVYFTDSVPIIVHTAASETSSVQQFPSTGFPLSELMLVLRSLARLPLRPLPSIDLIETSFKEFTRRRWLLMIEEDDDLFPP